MTKEQIENLKLGITPIDDRTILVIESGLDWVKANTTLEFNVNDDESLRALPSAVKLFLIKFFDLQMIGVGIASESIEGLSQSFRSESTDTLLWQYAEELLSPYLSSKVRFVSAKKRWN